MRCSPAPFCSCGCLMVESHPGGPWLCMRCDLVAVRVVGWPEPEPNNT